MTKQHEEFQKFKEKLRADSVLSTEVFELCFDLAWDLSHAYGYHEVESRFQDIESLFYKTWNIGYNKGYSFGYDIGYDDGVDDAHD